MNNRPVSEALQARAAALGFGLDHLAITIGSVVHGIDLHKSASSEEIRFIRDVLLERKVVFLRDQHLTEDEQVAFGRKFGELDAFPFGPAGDNPYILEIRHGRNTPGADTDGTWMSPGWSNRRWVPLPSASPYRPWAAIRCSPTATPATSGCTSAVDS